MGKKWSTYVVSLKHAVNNNTIQNWALDLITTFVILEPVKSSRIICLIAIKYKLIVGSHKSHNKIPRRW